MMHTVTNSRITNSVATAEITFLLSPLRKTSNVKKKANDAPIGIIQ